ncbi:MAG: hypothetical protein IKC08_08830, partial [Lentisphaeria bacterium]|nr:hypothetical protein [Lentisphaeria bacterium]
MKILLKIVCFTLSSLLFFNQIHAQTFVRTQKAKKVIKVGWDAPQAEFFCNNIKMLDEYLPHDGLTISLNRMIPLPNGKKSELNHLSFSKHKFQKEWFIKDIAYLKKGNESTKHLKHNFLTCASSNFLGEFDAFDDEFWKTTCYNYKILAQVAKEGKCKGLAIDIEDYGMYHSWKYSPASGHTWEEAWKKTRQRGREWIRSITEVYPDITLFFYFFLDLAMGPADGTVNLFERLQGSRTGLLPAFINGIYDGLPPEAKIVDGIEGMSYGSYDLASFYKLLAVRENRIPRLISDENQGKFRRQTSIAIATYLSCYTNEKPPFFFRPHMEKAKMTPTGFFRRNFAHSVDFSGEYVWTYNESRKWYPFKYPYAWMENSLKKDKNVPGPYVGMALPGIEEAIKFGRDPWGFAQNKLKDSSQLVNMLKNPSFEGSSGKKAVAAAADSLLLKTLPHWENWKPERSKVKFTLAEMAGRSGNAVMVTGKGSGVTHQGIKIDPNGA